MRHCKELRPKKGATHYQKRQTATCCLLLVRYILNFKPNHNFIRMVSTTTILPHSNSIFVNLLRFIVKSITVTGWTFHK